MPIGLEAAKWYVSHFQPLPRYPEPYSDSDVRSIERRGSHTQYHHNTRAFQAQLVGVIYSEASSRQDFSPHTLSVLECTPHSLGTREIESHHHSLAGEDGFNHPLAVIEATEALPHHYVRSRLDSLCSQYAAEKFPPGWRLAEGVFPGIGDEEAIHLTVLLKPVKDVFGSVYSVARYRCV